ncbi:MAG: gliding motility protein GldL [Bacteroidota bacterium]
MKNKYIIIAFIIGVIITILGALFKIIHFEFGPFTGNLVLTIGMTIKVIAAILFITKLLGTNSEFLNK